MFDNFETMESPDYTRKEAEYRAKEQQIKRFNDKLSCLLHGSEVEHEENVSFLSPALLDTDKYLDIIKWVDDVVLDTIKHMNQLVTATYVQLQELEAELNNIQYCGMYLLERKDNLLSGASFEELLDIQANCINVHKRISQIELGIKIQEMKLRKYREVTKRIAQQAYGLVESQENLYSS